MNFKFSFMEICQYPNGERILNVMGRGILVVLNDDKGMTHHLGDVWTFWFREHTKDVKVKGIEKMAYAKPIALCFGAPFCKEEIEQMKTGEVNITRIIDNRYENERTN